MVLLTPWPLPVSETFRLRVPLNPQQGFNSTDPTSKSAVVKDCCGAQKYEHRSRIKATQRNQKPASDSPPLYHPSLSLTPSSSLPLFVSFAHCGGLWFP